MLSVDLKVSRDGCVLICRGELIGGKEADYLFDLMTRDDHGEVVLDLNGVIKIDDQGVSVIVSAHEILAKKNRRLLLRRPSADLVRMFRSRQMEKLLDPDLRRAATPSSSVQ